MVLLGLLGMDTANWSSLSAKLTVRRGAVGLIRAARGGYEHGGKSGATFDPDLRHGLSEAGQWFEMSARRCVVDPVRGAVYGGEYDIIADASGTVGSCEIVLGTKKKTLRIEIDPVIGSVVVKGYGKEN